MLTRSSFEILLPMEQAFQMKNVIWMKKDGDLEKKQAVHDIFTFY